MFQDSEKSDSADQEIPDRATANAAKWLSDQKVELDTPTFWLVASLLPQFSASEVALAVAAERKKFIAYCGHLASCKFHVWFEDKECDCGLMKMLEEAARGRR